MVLVILVVGLDGVGVDGFLPGNTTRSSFARLGNSSSTGDAELRLLAVRYPSVSFLPLEFGPLFFTLKGCSLV